MPNYRYSIWQEEPVVTAGGANIDLDKIIGKIANKAPTQKTGMKINIWFLIGAGLLVWWLWKIRR